MIFNFLVLKQFMKKFLFFLLLLTSLLLYFVNKKLDYWYYYIKWEWAIKIDYVNFFSDSSKKVKVLNNLYDWEVLKKVNKHICLQKDKDILNRDYVFIDLYANILKHSPWYLSIFNDIFMKKYILENSIITNVWALYWTDYKNIYFYWNKINTTNPNKFKLLIYNYAYDEKNVYFFWKKIDNIDVNSFVILDNWYIKDKNWTYKLEVIHNKEPYMLIPKEIKLEKVDYNINCS